MKLQSLPLVFPDWLWERKPFGWPWSRFWGFLRPSVDISAPCFLIPLWQNSLSCVPSLDPSTHQIGCSQPPFSFPRAALNLKLVISPCPADVGRLSAHAQQPSAEVHSCCHWEHTKGTTTGQRGEAGEGGCISVRHTECWSNLWPAGGIHGQGDPRGLLDGVLDLASRIRVLLMSSKSPICLSPSLFPPFSQAVLSIPHGTNPEPRRSLLALSCATLAYLFFSLSDTVIEPVC